MTPKVFDTLLALVSESGRALTTDELIERVWPDAAVGDGSLAQNILVLRKLLDPAQYASMPPLNHLLDGYSGDELEQLENYLSGQKHVDSKTRPTFMFVSYNDKEINPQNSVLLYEALVTAGVQGEAHFFQKGKHGAGIAAREPYESVWPALFQNWLCEKGLLGTPWKLIPELPASGSIR